MGILTIAAIRGLGRGRASVAQLRDEDRGALLTTVRETLSEAESRIDGHCDTIVSSGDPQLYRAFGIEPSMYDLVVVKANTSFRVGYAKIAGEIYEADTPGAAAPDLLRLSFRKMTERLYPWTDDTTFKARARVRRLMATAPHGELTESYSDKRI
jgi:MlrC C-terminus